MVWGELVWGTNYLLSRPCLPFESLGNASRSSLPLEVEDLVQHLAILEGLCPGISLPSRAHRAALESHFLIVTPTKDFLFFKSWCAWPDWLGWLG